MTSKKRKNLFTVMIIPHSERPTLIFNISLFLVQTLGFLVVVSIVLMMIFSYSYQHMRVELAEYSMKAEEYKLLREQVDFFAKETEMLQEKMKALEKLDTDIRVLMKHDPAIEKLDDTTQIKIAQAVLESNSPYASRGGGFQITRNPTTIREQMNADLEMIKNEMDAREDSLTQLRSAVQERHDRLAATPSIWPVRNARITSPFGYRRSPLNFRMEFHSGIDLATNYGAPVYAASDGVVTFSGWRSGYGWTVIISNDYGFTTLYAHNSQLLVKRGTKVSKGDIIAKVGSSGRSTGPHLHYEVWVNGSLVNPKEYLH